MSLEANKALVRQYVELWETGNLALAEQILAADFMDQAHPEWSPGPEGIKQDVLAFRAAFSDVKITVEHVLSEQDMVAFSFSMRGTHQGVFAGLPPTGKEIVLIGADFLRIADGKIAELWSYQDTLSWVKQLGLTVQ
ncbi:MAG TPA: ester cyclase [Ktedonobacterales bacterium]|jgi:steroid delta-isomerase-like uncharacterized protein